MELLASSSPEWICLAPSSKTAQLATTLCTRGSICSTATPTGTSELSGDSATWCKRHRSTSQGDGGTPWELGAGACAEPPVQVIASFRKATRRMGHVHPERLWAAGLPLVPSWCPSGWASSSVFAHQFLDPGTYVFHDNGQPEGIAVVRVQEEGAACGPGLAPIQPSSPYQLRRLGVLQRELLLGPDWAAITGILLAAGLATTLLTGLGLLLRTCLPQACPMRVWRPRWRSLGCPHVPTEHELLRDSFLFCEDRGCWGSGTGAELRMKTMTWGAGEPPQAQTLEDFSVRTLYDKLEDQNLHVASQLSRHQRDVLAFYRAAGQQLQELQNFLQGLSMTDLSTLGRDGQCETGARGAMETETGQSETSRGSHAADSPREHWPRAVGCTARVSSLSLQPELDRVIAALASVLSQARVPLPGASRKASGQCSEQAPSSSQSDPCLSAQALPPVQEPQGTRPQQDPRPLWRPQGNAEGSAQSPDPGTWILKAGPRHGVEAELQRKIRQVEDTLDKLNEEFFQLTAQALELQSVDKPNQLPAGEGNTFVVASSMLPGMWWNDRADPMVSSHTDIQRHGPQALEGEQALALEVQRIHLAQQIEDLEWELSLLLQVANGGSRAERTQSSCRASLEGSESH
ncbi:PREDICTED: uncharacterized protein LOC106146844 [Chinchilla lanigera]|uniref:uncharacterized protein LOC106146844 n=1 Tax=Chinchilla lanigera TaxID=34839 RepID=UPI0006966F1A|nr:PREDICTED: uncharacterized protein LOC106146844 [Chinchilla lanigera]